jgi:hypothetical protein
VETGAHLISSIEEIEMNNQRIFTLEAIGLAKRDLLLLKSICVLSLGRANVYTFAMAGVPADLYVADADDVESLSQWKAASAKLSAPTLFISWEPAAVLRSCVVPRPVIGSWVLAMLDKITANELSEVVN